MNSNKENEDKSCGTSKIPVLIRSLPKSERPQPKLRQQRLLKTVARDPLTTLGFQHVNQNLAGPSYAQTCVQNFVKDEKYLQKSAGETRNPLQTLTCVNQNVDNSTLNDEYPKANKIVSYLNSEQSNNFKCLAGPTLNIKEKLKKPRYVLDRPDAESNSKIPVLAHLQKDQNTTNKSIPLVSNSDLEIVTNPCLAGPSNLKIESSLGYNSEMCKADGMIAAFKKERILASSLNKSNYFTPPLELGSVKKVKRSLKRPHSRGLQSLPPFDIDLKKDAKKIDDFDETEKNTNEAAVIPVIDDLTHCYTTDVLLYLHNTERIPIGSNIPDDCRSCIVDYMLQLNGATGQPAVIQIAVWYMDSLSSIPGSIDQLRLTAAACMWVASKFHVCSNPGMRVVRRSNYSFTVKDLALTEKRLLDELKFPRAPVIPQDFMPFLCWWCDPTTGIIEAAATFLCLCGLTVSKRIGLEYASVVAVASVKTALELLRMEEQGRRLEECPLYHAAIKKADISAVCAVLRESLHKMVAVNYEYRVLLKYYSLKPYLIASKLANAIYYDQK